MEPLKNFDRVAGQPVLRVTLKEVTEKIMDAVRGLKGVRRVNVENSSRLMITVDDIESATPEVVRRIVYAGGMILSVSVLRPSLEEAYLKLVKEEWS